MAGALWLGIRSVQRACLSAAVQREGSTWVPQPFTEQVACGSLEGLKNYMKAKWVYNDVGGSGWRQERIIIKIIYNTNVYSSLIMFQVQCCMPDPIQTL